MVVSGSVPFRSFRIGYLRMGSSCKFGKKKREGAEWLLRKVTGRSLASTDVRALGASRLTIVNRRVKDSLLEERFVEL